MTVVRANDLKNMEMIGKSDPYVVPCIRPILEVQTKVVENNLNPVRDQTCSLIAEDKETESIIIEVSFINCSHALLSCLALVLGLKCYFSQPYTN